MHSWNVYSSCPAADMMARCFTHADRQQINFCYWSCYMWRWKPKLRAVNSNPLTLSPPSAHCHSLPSAFDECRLFAINQQSCCRPHPPSPCISITCCCELSGSEVDTGWKGSRGVESNWSRRLVEWFGQTGPSLDFNSAFSVLKQILLII